MRIGQLVAAHTVAHRRRIDVWDPGIARKPRPVDALLGALTRYSR